LLAFSRTVQAIDSLPNRRKLNVQRSKFCDDLIPELLDSLI
jgi:hypothetical protein